MLVHTAVLDEFVARLIDQTVALTIGLPTKDTFMGPMLSAARQQQFLERIRAAKAQGAEPLRTADPLDLPGYFASPSLHLIRQRQPASDYQREELFGPDLAVYPIVDVDDALQLADAGPYGLCASLFTESPQRWRRFSEEVRAGSLLWNRGTASPSGRMPFGGAKQSGYGGRGGADAMLALRREVSLLGRTSETIDPMPGTELPPASSQPKGSGSSPMSGYAAQSISEVERQLAEQWLSSELNRMWLVAERCLRQFQRAQLRPQPDNPALAEIEGIFTARRAARGGHSTGPLDEAELQRALSEVEAGIAALRKSAPIGRMVENLNLNPLEVETLIVSMAPHIDAPLSDVFTLLRGSPARRGVDLALIAQLYQLKRSERLLLLDSLDPERPLLSWRMIQVMPVEAVESYSSVNYRAIMPTYDVLSVLTGRGDLAPALARSAKLLRGSPTLADLALDDTLLERMTVLCDSSEAAKQRGQLAHMPWILLWGPKGAGKTELAKRVAAFTGRPLLTFDPNQAGAGHPRRHAAAGPARGALARRGFVHRPDPRRSAKTITPASSPAG